MSLPCSVRRRITQRMMVDEYRLADGRETNLLIQPLRILPLFMKLFQRRCYAGLVFPVGDTKPDSLRFQHLHGQITPLNQAINRLIMLHRIRDKWQDDSLKTR